MDKKKIVLCSGLRTPIGQMNKSLATFMPEELMRIIIKEMVERTGLQIDMIDGAIIGWVGQGSHAPNIARIAGLKAGLPEKSIAFTIQANCISGLETVISAARRLLLGEGELFVAGGTESMSNMPYALRGVRRCKEFKSLDRLKNNWAKVKESDEVEIADCLLEGLTDPVKGINMAATAELVAQIYGIDRASQDNYALETYTRALRAIEAGRYDDQVVPVQEDKEVILSRDENPFLRKGLVLNPGRIGKAPLLFDIPQGSFNKFYQDFKDELGGLSYEDGKTQATLSPFNSCPMSDGAAAVLVTTEEKAKELGLEILAELKGWAVSGMDPAQMGLAPAYSTAKLLKQAQIKFEDIDLIELHEAFAATCLGIFKVGQDTFGHPWQKAWEEGRLNRNGGSLALGHPLAATGTRIILSVGYEMQREPEAKLGMATACAAGGLGCSILLGKYGA